MKTTGTVQSVERVLDILNCFTINRPELMISDIVKETGLPKTTALRLLNTLVQKMFIKKNETTNTYSLDVPFLRMGQVVKESIDIRTEALPIMISISELTQQTVSLNLIHNQQRVCIEKVDGHSDIRQFIKLGFPYPIIRGASGKVLLAYMTNEFIKSLLDDVEDINSEVVWNDITKIREKGFAFSSSERTNGAFAVSAPIFGEDNSLLAGLSISGLETQLNEENEQKYIQVILKGAKRISKKMGYVDMSL